MGVGNQEGTQTHYKHVELHFKSVLRRLIQIATSACVAALLLQPRFQTIAGKTTQVLKK
jgi:hypothetical protein